MKLLAKVPFVLALLGLVAAAVSAQTVSQIENEIAGHFDKLDKASNYGGTSDYDVLEKENQALRAALLKYGNRADVLAYSFPKLKDRITTVTSADGRLRTYSWDTDTGGTMHDFLTVYQFRGSDGKVGSWADPYSMDMEKRGAGAFVTQIFQTPSAAGTIYLTTSTFIGSTSLAGQTISALRIGRDRLDLKPKVIKTAKGLTDSISFEYDFFSVVDHPERPIKLVFYDPKNRSFRFPVVIEDSKTPQGRVTNKFITYKFDGKYFVKVS
ncbi:MAG: hypothetical protein JO314_05805 [Acidobacteria bacterium]|nr:hypothetical protein [Acidobacteriota bacterium]